MKIVSIEEPRKVCKLGNGAVIYIPKKYIGRYFLIWSQNKVLLYCLVSQIAGLTAGYILWY